MISYGTKHSIIVKTNEIIQKISTLTLLVRISPTIEINITMIVCAEFDKLSVERKNGQQ